MAKMTKKEYFAELRTLVFNYCADHDRQNDLLEFIAHEVELLNKKSSGKRKPTAKQIQNEEFKQDILAALADTDKPITIKALAKKCGFPDEMSNQRITHLLTALRKDGKVKREYIKRVAHFSLGTEEEEE